MGRSSRDRGANNDEVFVKFVVAPAVTVCHRVASTAPCAEPEKRQTGRVAPPFNIFYLLGVGAV